MFPFYALLSVENNESTIMYHIVTVESSSQVIKRDAVCVCVQRERIRKPIAVIRKNARSPASVICLPGMFPLQMSCPRWFCITNVYPAVPGYGSSSSQPGYCAGGSPTALITRKYFVFSSNSCITLH